MHTYIYKLIMKTVGEHNDKDFFYADDDHPSITGSKMINDLIIKGVNKISQ